MVDESSYKCWEVVHHTGRPKPAIVEASVRAGMVTNISGSIGSLYQIIGKDNGGVGREGAQ